MIGFALDAYFSKPESGRDQISSYRDGFKARISSFNQTMLRKAFELRGLLINLNSTAANGNFRICSI
jgi:hypothetical protein